MSKPPPTSTPSRPTTQTKLGRFKNFFFRLGVLGKFLFCFDFCLYFLNVLLVG